MKKLDGVPPINQFFSPRKILRIVKRVLKSTVAIDKLLRKRVEGAKSNEQAYKECFNKAWFDVMDVIPLDPPTHVMENWEKDTEFARQFFCGTNPVMIEVATDPKKQLSKQMNDFLGGQLQTLADNKQLLFVSYDDLADVVENGKNPHQSYPLPVKPFGGPNGEPLLNEAILNGEAAPQDQPRYCYAPIVTFTYDPSNDELDVLAIQLERTKDARVYTKNTCGENEWLFAKVGDIMLILP